MPAGNDKEAAAAELADRFGTGDARAEDLIQAQQDAYPQELREAQLLGKDEEASAEVDWSKAAKAAKVDEDKVLDVAVRGKFVVVVWTDEDGRDHKAWGLAEDAGVDSEKVKTRPAAKKSGKGSKSDD